MLLLGGHSVGHGGGRGGGGRRRASPEVHLGDDGGDGVAAATAAPLIEVEGLVDVNGLLACCLEGSTG